MSVAIRKKLLSPREGETPLHHLASKGLTVEDYAFGNQAALAARVSEGTLQRLQELSIETQEELLGYLEVPTLDEKTAGALLESSPERVVDLKNYLKATSNLEMVTAYDSLQRETYAFGALLSGDASEAAAVNPNLDASIEVASPNEDSHFISGQCLPPIKDQDARGTCVAFATCAVVEFAYCVHQGKALDLSEQFQFWHAKQHDGKPHSDSTRPDVSFALVGAYGICDESEWHYDGRAIPGNVSHDPPGPSPRIDPRPPNTPSAPFTRVTTVLNITPATDVAKIRGYISNGHAVAVAIPVFNSWYSNPYTRLTGNIPMPFSGEPSVGGHAFVLTGWANDSTFAGGGYFVVRNSWGHRWGSKSTFGAGHGTIPFDFIASFNHFAHTVKV